MIQILRFSHFFATKTPSRTCGTKKALKPLDIFGEIWCFGALVAFFYFGSQERCFNSFLLLKILTRI